MPEWIKYLSDLLEDVALEKTKKNQSFSTQETDKRKQEIFMLKEYNKNRTRLL